MACDARTSGWCRVSVAGPTGPTEGNVADAATAMLSPRPRIALVATGEANDPSWPLAGSWPGRNADRVECDPRHRRCRARLAAPHAGPQCGSRAAGASACREGRRGCRQVEQARQQESATRPPSGMKKHAAPVTSITGAEIEVAASTARTGKDRKSEHHNIKSERA